MARIPLVTNLVSRDGTLDKAARIINGYAEGDNVVKRPALTLLSASLATPGGGLFAGDEVTYAVGGSELWGLYQADTPAFSGAYASNPTNSEFGVILNFRGSIFLLSCTQTPTFDGLVYRKGSPTATWIEVGTGANFSAETATASVAAVYDGKMWVIGKSGSNQQIYYSADGVTWTTVDIASAVGVGSLLRGIVAHGPYLYILARDSGNTALTMYRATAPQTAGGWSSIGATNLATNYTGFGLVSFQNALYLVAGHNGTSNVDDILRSTDGVTWTTVSSAPGFAATANVATFVHLNTLVFGPVSGVIWTSPNGTTWTAGDTIDPGAAHGTSVAGTALIMVNSGVGGASGKMFYSSSDDGTGFNAVSLTSSLVASSGVANLAMTPDGTTLFIRFSGQAYTWNGSTLSTVSDAQYPAETVPGAIYMNGNFFVMDPDGTIWNSAEDDPTSWADTDFVTAEFEPDGGVCLSKHGQYAIAFGTYTTEAFYYGNTDGGSPLLPVETGVLLIGCAHAQSVAQVEGSVVWVAQQKAQDSTFHKGRFVVVMQGLSYARISTPDIERILDADNFIEVYSSIVTIAGRVIYLLSLLDTDITLAYDFTTKLWYQWSLSVVGSAVSVSTLTQSNGVATATTGLAHGFADGGQVTIAGATPSGYNQTINVTVTSPTTFTYPVSSALSTPATGTITATGYSSEALDLSASVRLGNMQIVQRRSDGKIYSLDITGTSDNGAPIDFGVVTQILDEGNNDIKGMSRLEVIGDKVDTTVLLRVSDNDYVSWTKYRRFDTDAERVGGARWGTFRRRAFQLRQTLAAQVRFSALEAKGD